MANALAEAEAQRNKIAEEIWNGAWGGRFGKARAQKSNFKNIAKKIKNTLNIRKLNKGALKTYMSSNKFKAKWAGLSYAQGRGKRDPVYKNYQRDT